MPKILFSEVHGTVHRAGRPVPGAVVEREYRWSNAERTGADRTLTDGDGAFHFPAALGRFSLRAALNLAAPLIEQRIRITVDGAVHEGWECVKHNYDAHGELRGRPLRLRCDVATEPRGRVFLVDDVPFADVGYYGVGEVV